MAVDSKQAITWTIAALCGGLGGAVLTQWYTNRSTVIEYTVTKTVIGEDQATVVPDLELKAGGTKLKSLHTYTVKFQHTSGPEIENVRVGFELTPAVRLIGTSSLSKPAEVHNFDCEPFKTHEKSVGTRCVVNRLSENVGAYSLAFATDADAKVVFSADGRHVQAKEVEISSAPNRSSGGAVGTIREGMLYILCIMMLLFVVKDVIRSELRRIGSS